MLHIAGRSTIDNSIIIQEVVHSMSNMTGRKGMMIIKLDLEKAYDRMDWSFIEDSLSLLSIPPHLIAIIKACLASLSLSINWHGRASENFTPSCGIRQGDPLSTYLFVIAMERLSHAILDAVEAGDWKPMKFGRGGSEISHLMFADDLRLISEAYNQQALKAKSILDTFCTCSGRRSTLVNPRCSYQIMSIKTWLLLSVRH